MSTQSHFVPDPIHGTIELPNWLVQIIHEPAIRRMMFIRQLGLKAYIDFPGAIHTRYSHALGTMHLSGKMIEMLCNKMRDKGMNIISDNLQNNKNNVMAAAFLHDVAHGPFSHVMDFVMRKISGKTHEELAENIILKVLPAELENWGITKNSLVQLIKGSHEHQFLRQIINGPLDADKLDYLLRDAHHVGYRYSFDLDHFLRSYTILGEEKDMTKCVLGLDSSQQAIVTAELFLVIWRSMYDLVYHVEGSRICEKMLEKAMLLCKDDSAIRNTFDIQGFLDLDDEKLLSLLRNSKCNIKRLLAVRESGRMYTKVSQKELKESEFKMTTPFLSMLRKDPDELSDKLSLQLNRCLNKAKYTVICDIVRSRTPEQICLDEIGKDGQEVELSTKSKLVGAIQPINVLKVYVEPTVAKELKKDKIDNRVGELVEGGLNLG